MLANRLVQFLVPIIGQGPAKRLILSYCAHKNITPQEMGPDHLPELGQFLSKNLTAFVGKDQAGQLVKMFASAG